MLDISPSQLSDWETGQTSFSADQLYKIADVLKVDPGWLLVGERNVMDESLSRDDDLIFYTELKHKMDLGLAQYQVEAMRGNMSPQLFGEIIMAAMQAITDVRKERGLRDTFAG